MRLLRYENGSEVVHIGQGRACPDEVVQPIEETVAVMRYEIGLRIEAEIPGSLQCVGCDEGAGGILGAVNPVCIA